MIAFTEFDIKRIFRRVIEAVEGSFTDDFSGRRRETVISIVMYIVKIEKNLDFNITDIGVNEVTGDVWVQIDFNTLYLLNETMAYHKNFLNYVEKQTIEL